MNSRTDVVVKFKHGDHVKISGYGEFDGMHGEFVEQLTTDGTCSVFLYSKQANYVFNHKDIVYVDWTINEFNIGDIVTFRDWNEQDDVVGTIVSVFDNDGKLRKDDAIVIVQTYDYYLKQYKTYNIPAINLKRTNMDKSSVNQLIGDVFNVGDAVEFERMGTRGVVRGTIYNISGNGESGSIPMLHVRPMSSNETTNKEVIGDFKFYISEVRYVIKIKLFDYRDLNKKKPCSDGYIWFLEQFGHSKVTYKEVIDRLDVLNVSLGIKLQDYKRWAENNLSEYDTSKPVYKGKFCVGQDVYIENYGIGSFAKTKISKIEISRDKTHFIFQIITPFSSTSCQITYQYRDEKDLFVSLEHLKAHWIEKITKLKEVK